MIGLIVAYSNNRVIGNEGRIPWRIKGEQKRFKELTTGNVVIMGRRSYEEIGHPLPNRDTIVISNTVKYEAKNCTTVGSLREALELVKDRDAFISGGARLYEEAIDFVDVMYVTHVNAQIEGDTFFPEFDENLFEKSVEKSVSAKESESFAYDYVTYTRKK